MLLLSFTIGLALLYNLVKYVIDKFRRAMPQDLDELFKAMDRFTTKDLKKIRLLHKNVIFVNNPQMIHKVLASDVCLEKPQLIYKLLCLNDGLLTSKCEFSTWCRLSSANAVYFQSPGGVTIVSISTTRSTFPWSNGSFRLSARWPTKR